MARKDERTAQTPIRAAAMAALELTADKPWDHVSIHAIARKADIGLDDLYDMGGKSAVLGEIDRVFDRAMGAGMEPLADDAEPMEHRERLVEVMMQRFDIMEKHRDAVTNIHDYIMSHPAEAAKATARRLKTARWALAASEIDDGTGVRALALAASFMRTKGVWLSDEAPNDRTLAAIDKDLRNYSDWMDDFSGVTDKVKDFFSGLGDTISGEFKSRRAGRRRDEEDSDDDVKSEATSDTTSEPDSGKPSGAPPPPPL